METIEITNEITGKTQKHDIKAVVSAVTCKYSYNQAIATKEELDDASFDSIFTSHFEKSYPLFEIKVKQFGGHCSWSDLDKMTT